MFTRRNALAALPAGLLLEAGFVSSAVAQTSTRLVPVPEFLRVQSPQRALEIILKRRKPGITYDKPLAPGDLDQRGLEEFVRICSELGKLRRDFGAELSVTTQILEFFRWIFDAQFPTIKGKEFTDYTAQILKMSSTIPQFLTVYIDRERREDSNDRFAKKYADSMDAIYPGPPVPWRAQMRDRAGADNERLDKLRTLPTAICLSLLSDNFADVSLKDLTIRRKNDTPLKSPKVYQVLLLTDEDLAIPENSVIKNQILPRFRTPLFRMAVELLEVGHRLGNRRFREFHGIVFAYAVYHFVVTLLRDVSYSDHLLHARTSTLGRLASAYSFFTDETQELQGQSIMLRRQINGLPRHAYMGSNTEGVPKFRQTDTCEIFTGADVVFTNFYLMMGTEQIAGDSTPDNPPFDDEKTIPPYQFKSRYFSRDKSRIAPTVVAKDHPDAKRLNELGRPALRDRFPGSERTAQSRPSSFPPRNNTDQSTYDTFVPIIVDTLNREIEEVETDYRSIQLEYNCLERMAGGLLLMLAAG